MRVAWISALERLAAISSHRCNASSCERCDFVPAIAAARAAALGGGA